MSAALLAAYALTAIGVPLPVAGRSERNGELYPCAQSKCGCDSAERCWRACCCHTLAERLAWARRHGVRPPEFALAKARAAGLEVQEFAYVADMPRKAGNCCQSPPVIAASDCCRSKLTSRAVPQSKVSSCCEAKDEDGAASKESRGVVALRAMKCRGQSTNWLAAVPTLILLHIQGAAPAPMVQRLGPAASEVADGIAADPAVPPPKLA